MREFRVFDKDGRYGLAVGNIVLLPPVYTTLEITNDDPPEYQLSYYAYEPSIHTVREWNFPIVIGDGKQGLGSPERRMQLEVKYDRIIKLTYCHYLCQEQTAWTLYEFLPVSTASTPFVFAGEVTLENLLRALAAAAPSAHAALLKKLQKTSNPGRYVSDYRYYLGEQDLGIAMYHGFVVATTKSIITNDFDVMPALDRWGEWV